MAAEANRSLLTHADELKISKEELAEVFKSVRIISTAEESKALTLRNDPAIIIAASGMATGGRVLHHLKALAPDAKNTLLFVGYQAEGTRGDTIVRGADKVKIHGAEWPIRAEVINLETLSAHADSDEILDWIRSLKKKPRRIFVTHGEASASMTLRQRIINELGIEAIVPEHEQEFELS